MDPIKPVQRISKDNEGQASALAEVVRERYWKQKAQEIAPVEASEEAAHAAKKQSEHETDHAPAQAQHTYAEFEVNRETREVIVRVIDADSGKLVRTIPADELVKEIIKGNFQPNQLRRRAVLV